MPLQLLVHVENHVGKVDSRANIPMQSAGSVERKVTSEKTAALKKSRRKGKMVKWAR